MPSRLGIPEPTLLDVLSKAEMDKRCKKITNISQWVMCFNTYVTIRAMKRPQDVSDLLAYSSIIVKASRDFEETPWLAYDAAFRRDAATDPSGKWAAIDSARWSLYFGNAKAKQVCRDCYEPGHASCMRYVNSSKNSRYQPYPKHINFAKNLISKCAPTTHASSCTIA